MIPQIYLAIDNCFASKRWTEPEEWMEVVRSLGLSYVEGSADTECDPLYMGDEYMARWVRKVNAQKDRFGIKMSNLYSGHGTYATLGLAHTDPAVRERFLNGWLKKMIDTAEAVNAGLGFFCHAFSDSVLQNPERYRKSTDGLIEALSALATYAAGAASHPVAVEQMYTPHQIPWTVEGSKRLLRQVYAKSRAPLYLTIDLGHQVNQRKLLQPTETQLFRILDAYDAGEFLPDLWLGPQTAIDQLENKRLPKAQRVKKIIDEMNRCPYLFARECDGDPYLWLCELSRYSPMIHLQQTDGKSSAHWPFTADKNALGIIHPQKVLEAIAESYKKKSEEGMPPRVEKIYLTLEIFTGTAAISRSQLENIRRSVEYWRAFIPYDGMRLDRLL